MSTELKDICANHGERSDCPLGMGEIQKTSRRKSNNQVPNDEICRECDNHMFIIEELRCPVCYSREFDLNPVSVEFRKQVTYRYMCRSCDRKLLAFSKL